MTEAIAAGPIVAAAPTPPTFGLTKFLDPLRIPRLIRAHSWWRREQITVRMERTEVQLHSQLRPTTVFAYNGEFPGPTIEVRSGETLRVAWTNEVDDGPYPLVAVRVASSPTAGLPGWRGDVNPRPIEGVADLPAWHVVHLHGARTPAGNDGWASNAVLTGETQLAEYPNGQPAGTFWYHDHAMDITRLNVLTGLVGMYLIRDEEEAALDLPRGRHEVPLIIADRNLDVDENDALTGRMLYKVVQNTAGADLPFSGPFTLVNGVIWPHLEVEARWYRFRVLNSSNARTYQLDLVDEEGTSQLTATRLIGTDGGLLPAPTELPPGGLSLAPSERADLLIDFSQYEGRSLRLTNRAGNAAPEPDVMEFRVGEPPARESFTLPQQISRSYVRIEHGTTLPKDHDHVWIAFTAPGTAGDAHPQMWELRELTDVPVPPEGQTAIEGIIQVNDPATGARRTFERVATSFHDMTSIFLRHGHWAVWNVLHLGGPPIVHPLHLHLTQFQLLSRRRCVLGAGGNAAGFDPVIGGTTLDGPNSTATPIEVGAAEPLRKDEEGWKDTVQIPAGTLISLAGEFGGGNGSFMYHCHILDHEDAGMMRPFVVAPAEVLTLHPHGHGGH